MSDHHAKRGVRECDASISEALARHEAKDVKVVIAVDGEGCRHVFSAPGTTIEEITDEDCDDKGAVQPVALRGALARQCWTYQVTLPNGQKVWVTVCSP